MQNIKYEIIGSSSKGNCIIVEDSIMLDCGVSYKKIKEHLKKIKIIFISHVHKDHLLPSTIQKIAYEHPTMKFLCGNKEVVNSLFFNNVDMKNIFLINNYLWYNLGFIKCMVQPLSHDAMNNCIHIEYKNKKLLYAVDTSNLSGVNAFKYDLYLIEGNYEKKTLDENRKTLDENFEYDYLYRVENTHLSVEQAMDYLIENMGNNSQYQLIHQSDFNIKKRSE